MYLVEIYYENNYIYIDRNLQQKLTYLVDIYNKNNYVWQKSTTKMIILFGGNLQQK